MDKFRITLILCLIGIFGLHACSQTTLSSKSSRQNAELVSVQSTASGVVATFQILDAQYIMDIESFPDSNSIMISSLDGKVGLLASTNSQQESGQLFVLYGDSGISDIALDLANRDFISQHLEAISAENVEMDSSFLLRMLPGDNTIGDVILIGSSTEPQIVRLDNNAGGSGGGTCRSPDSPSNNCRAKAEDYRDCKKEGGNCSDERDEAELACSLDINPNVGNFVL